MNLKIAIAAGLLLAAAVLVPTASAETITCSWSGGGTVRDIYIAACNGADETCKTWLGSTCDASTTRDA